MELKRDFHICENQFFVMKKLIFEASCNVWFSKPMILRIYIKSFILLKRMFNKMKFKSSEITLKLINLHRFIYCTCF